MSILASSVFVNAYSPPDTLKNTGFENDLNYWNNINKVLVVDDSQWLPSHTGGKSVMIIHLAPGSGSPSISQEINYRADKVTEVGGYFRNTGTEAARVRIFLHYKLVSDDSHKAFLFTTRWIPNDHKWNKVTLHDYQIYYESSTMYLWRVYFSFQNYGGGQLYVDDIFVGYDGGSTGGGWF